MSEVINAKLQDRRVFAKAYADGNIDDCKRQLSEIGITSYDATDCIFTYAHTAVAVCAVSVHENGNANSIKAIRLNTDQWLTEPVELQAR